MFSSAISGGIFLRHLAGSNSLYSNRTERSDAYIVGGFMEDIFGKELKPWQESEKPETEP